ncbi:MAG: hypothetical protein JSS36_07760 [Proteobacteria bacterium]|nr:hypothetical protein [Pseudomonadota bacterium]
MKDNLAALEQPGRSRRAELVSALLSALLLLGVVWQFREVSFTRLATMIPHRPAFWVVYAVFYVLGPASEWLIYRRVWGLPFSGMAALLRKSVSNELLLGYLGEVQFYAWARGRLNMASAPFGAIKDVTILSALTGNLATLAMLAWAWPFVMSGALGLETGLTFKSLGVVLITSFVILLFRQKLFSLPRRALWFITAVHIGRIAAYVGLAALMWHLVLADVPYGLWLVLATLRMLISRLPLLPNKDVVFAGLAVFMLGHDAQVAELMTMMAALLLVTHMAVGVVFALAELIHSRRLDG